MSRKIFVSFFIFLFSFPQDIGAENKKIYLIHWLKEGRTSLGDSFINYLKSKYDNIDWIERFANQDIKKVTGFINEIRKIKPDLIYVYSTTGILALAGAYDNADPATHITDIPIVAVAHSSPVGSKIVKEIGVPTGRNVTGVGHYVPARTTLNIMKEYTPSLKTISILISDEPNAKATASEIKNLESEIGYQSKAFFYKMEGTKIAPGFIDEVVTEILNEKPDMIYLPSDGVTEGNIQEIIASFIKHKAIHAAPIFTILEKMVLMEKTSTFGLFTSFNVMGLMAGLKAEEILFQGKKITEIPYSIGSQMTLAIRQDTMNELKVYPLISLLETAEILK